jgi:hypothetical protein
VCPKKLGHKDARVHYANLKQQTATTLTRHQTNHQPPEENQSMRCDRRMTLPKKTTTTTQTRGGIKATPENRDGLDSRSVSSGPNSVSDPP